MLILSLALAAALAQRPPAVKPLFDASAQWIWDGGPEKPVDTYRLFRKSFIIVQKPAKALLRITADAEYRLFINGQYAGRGPAPNPPSHISVDQIDVAKLLWEGRNAIGVLVYHLGIPSFPRMLARAGLIAQLDIGGQKVITDSTWQWHDAWWIPSGQKYSPFREFTEIQDGRSASLLSHWGYDDGDWKKAVAIGPIGTAPWSHPELRDIPLPEDRITWPKQLMFVSTSESSGFGPKEASEVLARAPEQSKEVHADYRSRFSGLFKQPVVIDASSTTITACFDFGREVSGYPQVTILGHSDGAILDIGYGEGLENDGHVSVRRQGNPSCDRIIVGKGQQTVRIFHHRAFRYMVLALHGGKVGLLTLPSVIESSYPNKDRGAFACSDSRLTRIWQVGRHTMRICMDQGFMDCPWRERGQYIGDGLAEGPVALYAFGDTKLMRRFLRQAKFCQPADGLLEPAYPSDWTVWHGQRGPNRIPGYGALWAVMLEQYVRNTDDVALAEELRPTLDRLLAWFEPHRGPDGLLRDIPEWNFIDWVKLDKRAEHACLNLQYLMALRAADSLDTITGVTHRYGREAYRVEEAFVKAHWDETRGLFRDAPGLYSVHTNALALLTVVDDPARAKRIIDQLEAADLVKPESPYFEGYVLRALAKHGRMDKALAIIRDKWGHMIDEGATTFWESYGGQWSLCHAWSCTPTALLSERVLGIAYDAPSKTVRFTAPPNLGPGLTWAQGVAPMTCGDVSVRWDRNADGLAAKVVTPKGLQLDIAMPVGYASMTLDGKLAKVAVRKGDRVIQTTGGTHVLHLAISR